MHPSPACARIAALTRAPARARAQGRGFDWCVAHLGKLLPPTDKGAEGSGPLTVAPGDSLSAPIALDTAADGLARVLRGAVPAARNASFSLHAEGVGARADAAWADEFLKLDGPELARLPLRADADARATLLWLRDFGVSLTKPGRDALPTPAQALPTDDGARSAVRRRRPRVRRARPPLPAPLPTPF